MAIVSRRLTQLGEYDGGVWAGWEATDSNGVVFGRSRRRWANQAAAQSALDAHDFTEELRDYERQLVYDFISNGGWPGDWTRRDLTVPGFDTYVLRTFARGRIKTDYDFMVNAAPWVRSIGPGSPNDAVGRIETLLSISNARATTIVGRANRIADEIAGRLIDDEADVDADA